MPCLTITFPTPPQIPDIFLPSFSTPTISFGEVGVTCCHFQIPLYVPPITLPLPPALLMPLITAMNALIVAALPVLDQIQLPDCPL